MDQQASNTSSAFVAPGELELGFVPMPDVVAAAYRRQIDLCGVRFCLDTEASEVLAGLLAPVCERMVWYGAEGMGDALRALGVGAGR